MRVKFPATVQFMRLGYEYQSLKDADIHPETRIFLNRFVPAIQRINSDKNLTVEQILATIEEIHGIIKNKTQTVGCRQNNPSICKYNGLSSVCAFVREDGICLHPSAKWAARYRTLQEETNGNQTP